MPARKAANAKTAASAASQYSSLYRPSFASSVVAWQAQHGRHGLPWQQQRNAYRVWLSEVMLQQTQVATVIPYFAKFTTQFADVAELAAAETDQVMQLWSGLGYYSRARNLHKCAQIVCDKFDGQFPDDFDDLQSLPGIGRSTAAAIAVFAFGQRHAILDGNVKRVFARYFGVTEPINKTATINALWDLADRHLPHEGLVAYTQGLMDLGATCCTRSRPNCSDCPVRADCYAFDKDQVVSLPVRARRKPLEQRRVTMLVLVDVSHSDKPLVLLRQRPDSGIWGGLLCLPESEGSVTDPVNAHLIHSDLPGALHDGAGQGSVARGRVLTPIDHTFTHFKLRIEPLLIDDPAVIESLRRQTNDSIRWLPFSVVADAALPAPVKSLLQSIGEDLKAGSNHLLFDQVVPDNR